MENKPQIHTQVIESGDAIKKGILVRDALLG